MNINSDKQNLLPIFSQQDQLSPYLSPLPPYPNFGDLQPDQELIDFQLIQSPFQSYDYQQDRREPSQNYETFESEQNRLQLLPNDQQSIQYQKQQPPIPVLNLQHPSDISTIIHFLIDNSDLPETDIKCLGQPLFKDNPTLGYVFEVLTAKFKKLKKTKEEMTKFCMRKAFKFVSDNQQNCKKKRKSSKQEIDQQGFSFQMPFRKNSSDKTMNSHFLKQVFSNKAFVMEYKNFLKNFRKIINEDNSYKVKYLAESIETHMSADNIKKIQEIKRFPWTKNILDKTQELAFKLLNFGDESISQAQ